MPRSVAIRELARLAGCSVATVSLALRKSPRVAVATRLRVEDLAKEHGYRANPLVAKLMTEKRAARESGVPGGKPTLRTLAKAAGCSPTTASLALRGSPQVSVKSRERIQRLAERISYRPSVGEIARAVRRGNQRVRLECSNVIAYVNLFGNREAWWKIVTFRRIYSGLCARAAEVGCSVQEFCAAEPGMTGKRLSRILEASGIQGVVIGGAPSPDAQLQLDWPLFSPVAQGFSLLSPKLSCVAVDSGQCLRLAMREGRRLGYRRIGLYVFSEIDLRCRQDWSGAFLAYQMTLPRVERVPICPMNSSGKKPFKRWFDRNLPDLILTFDGRVVAWLNEWGLDVPEDVGVVNLSAHPTHLRPDQAMYAWAGVDGRFEQIGAAAFDLVLAQMLTNQRGLPQNPRNLLVEGQWVDGWTVRKRVPSLPVPRIRKQRSRGHTV
jgi:LacI family transcriptional regulator